MCVFHHDISFNRKSPLGSRSFSVDIGIFFSPVFVGSFVYSLGIFYAMLLYTHAVYDGGAVCDHASFKKRHRTRFSGICFRKKST